MNDEHMLTSPQPFCFECADKHDNNYLKGMKAQNIVLPLTEMMNSITNNLKIFKFFKKCTFLIIYIRLPLIVWDILISE